ncbi:cytoskeleton-associated protein 2 [Conger conger]|nr:cytoskeleton-associated protein 2 [Conger conger]
MESHPAKKKTVPLENKAMEPVGTKRNNKENTKPANGHSASVTNKEQKETICSSAPLKSKNCENLGKLGDELKKPKTQEVKMRPSGKGDAVKKRQTHSQAFLSQHNTQPRKLVAEVAKPPASVPPKPLPGTYKGKVIQSKVSSFRKPTGGSGEAEPAGALTKPAKPNAGNKPQAVMGLRRKPPLPVPKRSTLKSSAAQNSRSKSVSSGAVAPTGKRAPNATAPRETSSRSRLYSAPGQLAKSRVLVPPARPMSGPESAGRFGSAKSTVTLKRKEMQQVSKPKAAVDNPKARIPSVTSSFSQYRITVETAEERKVKLAEWLTSNGKTLKRPPAASALSRTISRPAPSKPLPKLEAVTNARPSCETEPVTEQESGPEVQLVEQAKSSPELNAKPESARKGVPETAPHASSDIMNTTLDLLENSEMDLPVDPEIRMDNVVVNLCNAMEAMQAPSNCENGAQAEGDDDGGILEENRMETLAEMSKEEDDLKHEMHGIKEVKDGEAEGKFSAKKGVKMECADEMDGDEEDHAETPSKEAEGASVVRYSVKTTPYLQSVKQRIQSEAAPPGSGGRRQSAIKDLKFLTPVRRSLRIQRESSRLPGMLMDHDPCVSSLAELVKLDDDANAYIYRKNPALLEELPDQSEDLERF